MSEQARPGDTVRVHYTGKLEDGTVFDTSEGGDPLEFTIGDGTLIPGFEQVVIGMSTGETRSGEVSCDLAYGPYDEELVRDLPRAQFPPDTEVEVGQQFQAERPTGEMVILNILAVDGDTVTVDANHPLAGRDLIFEIALVEILG